LGISPDDDLSTFKSVKRGKCKGEMSSGGGLPAPEAVYHQKEGSRGAYLENFALFEGSCYRA